MVDASKSIDNLHKEIKSLAIDIIKGIKTADTDKLWVKNNNVNELGAKKQCKDQDVKEITRNGQPQES